MTVRERFDLRGSYVYRLYDAGEDLLYVGITNDVANRFREHRSKSWWPDVSQWKIVEVSSRADALYWEAEAILTEHPKHNVDVPSWQRYKALRSRAANGTVMDANDRMLLLEAENARLRKQLRELRSAAVVKSLPGGQSKSDGYDSGKLSDDSHIPVDYLTVTSRLSTRDLEFLHAMAVDDRASVAGTIGQRIGAGRTLVAKYRTRLLSAGLVESAGHGKVDFAIPGLRQYLRKNPLG